MFKQFIEQDLKKSLKALGFKAEDISVTASENNKFGDYTSNIALQLSKHQETKGYQSPREIANAIIEKLNHPGYLERVEVAGAGFINFYIKDENLLKVLEDKEATVKGQVKNILVEYADPNTHKEFHIGHLRTLVIGESVSRVLEYFGNNVFRVNYGSDIGPTVAKALWGALHLKERYEQIKQASLRDKAKFLGEAYALAHSKYETDSKIKEEIDNLNKRLYERDQDILPLWEETKRWSLGYFDTVYSIAGVEFDLRVNESEVDEIGKKIVEENIDKVFVEDAGAVIFPGEKYGLHNRVFLTSKGYPTYEGKEMGLIEKYQDVFSFDEVIILSDVQQASFFEVVTKATELIHPHLLGKRKYLGYGFVTLTTGKMSSRAGNVISAEELIERVKEAIKRIYISSSQKAIENSLEKIAVAAIKFYYLKYSINSDIVLDVEKSVSLQGDTGVYVLYTYVRTQSVLQKMPKSAKAWKLDQKITLMDEEEREVLRHLEYFDIFTTHAYKELAPNYICQYLLNLAKSFSVFYESCSILGSEKEGFRIELTKRVGETLKKGLYLLGIETIDKM